MSKGKLVVDALNKTCKWLLDPKDLVQLKRAESLLSDEFEFDSVPGKLTFELYPKGDKTAKEGMCTSFVRWNGLVAPVALSADLQLGTEKKCLAKLMKGNQGTGYDFCAPHAQETVCISVTAHQTKTAKDLPDLLRSLVANPEDTQAKKSLELLLEGQCPAGASLEQLMASGFSFCAQKFDELEQSRQKVKEGEAALAQKGRELEAAKRAQEGQREALGERGREISGQREALAQQGEDLEAAKQESERQKAALAQQGRELEAAKQEVESNRAALVEQGRELETLRALFKDAPGARARLEAAAAIIQRAWRAYTLKAKEGRVQAESLRAFHRHRQERRLSALQRFWRERRARLRQRRQEVEQLRERARGPTTEYDAIFALKSLSEFIATKQIEMHRSPASLLDLAVKARYRIVAVVGLYDKGKTFLINKLFGTDLPSGKLHTTRGLSFYWVEKRRMLVLDTAGVQGTVSYRRQSGAEAVQPVLDAQTTESFVFEMISRIAHHLIFVVNDLTWFEQKYIAMLHQKYVQKHQAKQLIVVHNLRTTGLVKEARELFTQQITQCYAGETSHLAELTFTSELCEGGPHVHHIGICDEATAAGEKFNDTNYKLVMNMLELRDMLGSPVMLPQLLEDELKALLPVFLNVELPEATDARPELVVDYVPGEAGAIEPSKGHVEAGRFVLRTSPENGRISMKTRGVISALGEIIAHDVTFQPLVNIYDKVHGGELKRIIEVECPGVARTGIKFKRMANGVKITIEKQKAIDEVGVKPFTPIRQHHGRWEQEFVFDSTEGEFKFDGSHFADGVLSVTLKRVEDSEWGLDDCHPAFQGSGVAAAAPAQRPAGDPSCPASPRSTISSSGFSMVASALGGP